MTPDEAQMRVGEIKERFEKVESVAREIRTLVLDFYERKGWKALGFKSFEDCARDCFGKSSQYIYQIKDAGKMEQQMLSAGAEISPDAPERHFRSLKTRLTTTEERVAAYGIAKQLARAEGRDEPTEKHIDIGIAEQEQRDQVNTSPFRLVSSMMNDGSITPKTGVKMITYLNLLPPSVVGQVLDLIARYGLSDPDLIPELGEMFSRGNESYTLPPIIASGTVSGTPLAKATMTDLKKAKREAAMQHQSEELAAKRTQAIANGQPLVEEVTTTLYKGDIERTVRALRRALGEPDYDKLAQYFVENLQGQRTVQ